MTPLLRSAAAIVAVTTSLAGCGAAPESTARPETLVRAQQVAFEPVVATISMTGTIAARTESPLSFKSAGRITELSATLGQKVERDQLLARIGDASQRADVASAEAGVDAARAQLQQAQLSYDRQESLLEQGFVTRASFESAETALATAKAGLASAEALLASARESLADVELRAPAAGVLTSVEVELGEVVQAGSPIITIAEDGPRDAVFAVPEIMLVAGSRETPVQIELFSDRSVIATGQLREMSPTLDAQTGTITVKVGLDATPDAMGLGAPVIGSVQGHSHERVVLPWTALWSQDGAPAVWVIDPQSRAVSIQPISVAGYRSEDILVASGLGPGQLVVTEGGKLLAPGKIVTVLGEAQ